MANATSNYGLIKPLEDEYYDVGVQNSNMDTIDNKIKSNEDGIRGLKREIRLKVPASAWNSSEEFFVAEISSSGIKASDNPIMFVVLDNIVKAREVKEYTKNYAFIHKGETLDGLVRFCAYKKPKVDLIIGLRGK